MWGRLFCIVVLGCIAVQGASPVMCSNSAAKIRNSRYHHALRTVTEKSLPRRAVKLTTGSYLFNKDLLSWESARQSCDNNNMHLLSIESPLENHIVSKYARLVGGSFKHGSAWTSGCYSAKTSQWIWQNNGTTISFFNWLSGQEKFQKLRKCIGLHAETSQWMNLDRSVQHPYICKL